MSHQQFIDYKRSFQYIFDNAPGRQYWHEAGSTWGCILLALLEQYKLLEVGRKQNNEIKYCSATYIQAFRLDPLTNERVEVHIDEMITPRDCLILKRLPLSKSQHFINTLLECLKRYGYVLRRQHDRTILTRKVQASQVAEPIFIPRIRTQSELDEEERDREQAQINARQEYEDRYGIPVYRVQATPLSTTVSANQTHHYINHFRAS